MMKLKKIARAILCGIVGLAAILACIYCLWAGVHIDWRCFLAAGGCYGIVWWVIRNDGL